MPSKNVRHWQETDSIDRVEIVAIDVWQRVVPRPTVVDAAAKVGGGDLDGAGKAGEQERNGRKNEADIHRMGTFCGV